MTWISFSIVALVVLQVCAARTGHGVRDEKMFDPKPLGCAAKFDFSMQERTLDGDASMVGTLTFNGTYAKIDMQFEDGNSTYYIRPDHGSKVESTFSVVNGSKCFVLDDNDDDDLNSSVYSLFHSLVDFFDTNITYDTKEETQCVDKDCTKYSSEEAGDYYVDKKGRIVAFSYSSWMAEVNYVFSFDEDAVISLDLFVLDEKKVPGCSKTVIYDKPKEDEVFICSSPSLKISLVTLIVAIAGSLILSM